MALGVFAGDAHQLSLAAAFPAMAALEHEHGSLIRGLLARRGRVRGQLMSLRDGMQSLPRALALQGNIAVRTGVTVVRLERAAEHWRLRVEGAPTPVDADAVILATEPWVTGGLLAGVSPELADRLATIHGPPVAVVALGLGPAAAERIPRGFGALVARGEAVRALGHLWDGRLYPGRNPPGCLLMRAIFGGAVDPEAARLPPDALGELARREVAHVYGITAPPLFQQVVQWPRAIPQYTVGHLERVIDIERRAAALPGLFLAGSGFHGVAFPAAAADGVRRGTDAARWLLPGALDRTRPAPYVG